MKYLIILLTFSFGDQLTKDDKVKWSETPITWSNFKGKIDTSKPFDAQLTSGISYSSSYESKNGVEKFSYEVTSYMDPKLSWSKKPKQTAYLLAHEQLHFDITELHTRLFRKELEETKLPKDSQKAVEKIFNKINKDRQQMQNNYDSESDHSKNSTQQAKWADYVKKSLEELSQYK